MVKSKAKIGSNYQQHFEVTKNLEIAYLVNLHTRSEQVPNYSAFVCWGTYVEVTQWLLVAAAVERVGVEEVEDVGVVADYQRTYVGEISLLIDYWNTYFAEKEQEADFG